jgi:ankyrin repeat protein
MSEPSHTDKIPVVMILTDALGYAEATRLGDVSKAILDDPQIAESRARDKFSTGRRTRLMYAAYTGNVLRAEELLRLGADIDAQDSNGCTALMYAAQGGHIHVIRYLCEKGAALDLQMKTGPTALCFAIYSNRLNVVHFLCEQGANVDLYKPILAAAESGYYQQKLDYFNMVICLAKHGAYLDLVSDSQFESPLTVATMAGHFDAVCTLVKHGADLNLHTKDLGTALCIAITYGHTALAHYLIEQGADIDVYIGRACETPLSLAIDRGDLEMVRILCNNGVNLINYNDESLYDYARDIRGETSPIARLLMAYVQSA